MKIRSGFVSNSSSSSFIIISKNGELTKEKIMKAIGADKLEKGTVIFKLAENLASDLINNSEETSPEEYKESLYLPSLHDDDSDEIFEQEYPAMYEAYKNIQTNNWKLYTGSADSCEEPMLCEMEIYYEDDDIKIEKDGGY